MEKPTKRYKWKQVLPKDPKKIYIKFPSRSTIEVLAAMGLGILVGLYLLTSILR